MELSEIRKELGLGQKQECSNKTTEKTDSEKTFKERVAEEFIESFESKLLAFHYI